MNRNEVYLTALEKQVAEFLDKKGIEYILQYPLRLGYVADFAILDQQTIIEVDGKHWHSGKKKQKKDRFRDYMLKRAGWKVVRIKEEEMSKIEDLLGELA